MSLASGRLAAIIVSALLAGCAHSPPAEQSHGADGAWHAVLLPGKRPTHYSQAIKDGRPALAAQSNQSASLWRRKLDVPSVRMQTLSFSWWVDDLIKGASVADADLEDAPARVLLAFGGDVAALPLRTRMLFDLAEALTGERPPYATLMYVWDATAALETVIVNPRSDRIRTIVVDSGPAQLRRWRSHRRDIAADFRRAFGEEPGALSSIAVMTDSDNTRSQAQAWYAPIATP